MFNTILVICTGNICRSPIAEALLAARLPGKKVYSAGVAALVGEGADPKSITACEAHGLNIDAHRAQQLTLPMLQNADLVLTLDQGHSNWINGRYPQFRGKVLKLGKWRGNQDVPDPYRESQEVFNQCFDDIEGMVEDWRLKLK